MATIYDVAQVCNVSPKTVARILNGDTKKSKNRDLVLKTAKKLGYVRNSHAASLRGGSSELVGIVLPEIKNPFYTTFVDTLTRELNEVGLKVLLSFSSPDRKQKQDVELLRTLESYHLCALIYNTSEANPSSDLLEQLNTFKNKIPVLVTGLSSALAKKIDVDTVTVRNQKGVYSLVVELANRGYRKMAFVGARKGNTAVTERLSGFKRGLTASGLSSPDHWMISSPSSAEASKEIVLEFLKHNKSRPDVLVCANDFIALGSIDACADLGLRIPEDIGITGFDNSYLSELLRPALSTVRQHQPQMASDCAHLLIARIRGEETGPPQNLVYLPEPLFRGTTR